MKRLTSQPEYVDFVRNGFASESRRRAGATKKLIARFDKQFPDEAACRAELIKFRWGDTFRCPRCGSSDLAAITPETFQCRSAACRKRFTVREGTIFENSPYPLIVWFELIWRVVACEETSVGIPDVWSIVRRHAPKFRGDAAQRLRPPTVETAFEWLWVMDGLLASAGQVPLDGTVFVTVVKALPTFQPSLWGLRSEGKLRSRESVYKKVAVLLAVELRGTVAGRCHMRFLRSGSRSEILQALDDTVSCGSQVIGQWKTETLLKGGRQKYAYTGIASLARRGVNLSNLKDPDNPYCPTGRLLRTFRNDVTAAKIISMRAHFIEFAVNEFVFRFNARSSLRTLRQKFDVLLAHATGSRAEGIVTSLRENRDGLKREYRRSCARVNGGDGQREQLFVADLSAIPPGEDVDILLTQETSPKGEVGDQRSHRKRGRPTKEEIDFREMVRDKKRYREYIANIVGIELPHEPQQDE